MFLGGGIWFYQNHLWQITLIFASLVLGLVALKPKQNWYLICLFFLPLLWYIIQNYFHRDVFEVGRELTGIEAKVITATNGYIVVDYNHSYLYINVYQNKFFPGQWLKIDGIIDNLQARHNFFNFNFKQILINKNIYKQLIDVKLNSLESNNLLYWFNYWIATNYKHELIQRFIFQKSSSGELKDIFSTLGLNFLLNLSGMNMFVVVFIFNKLVRNLKYKFQLKLLIHCLLFGFIYLIGNPLVFSRVVLGLFITNIFAIAKIKLNRTNKNCLIMFGLFFIDPLYFMTTSFLYLLVAFIFFKYNPAIKWWKNILLGIGKATLIFIPLQIYFAWRWNIFNEVFQVFLSPMIALCYLLTILLWWIPHISPFFDVLMIILVNSAKLLTKINLAWNIGHIPLIGLISYYGLMLGVMQRIRYWKWLIVFQILIIFGTFFINKWLMNNETLTMINVGNGLSMLYVNKTKNVVILFDAGNGVGFGKTNAADLIRYLGINHVNLAFVSHNHTDHYNGLDEIKKIVNISDVILNKNKESSWNIKDLILESWKLTNQLDENDNSRVILFKSENYNILFAGDLTKHGEKKLLKNSNFIQTIKNNQINLLIVGHHGSKTSTSHQWLNLVNPEKAFISGTKKGFLQFPNQQTIKNLKEHTIPYWVTQAQYNWVFNFNNTEISELKQ